MNKGYKGTGINDYSLDIIKQCEGNIKNMQRVFTHYTCALNKGNRQSD